MNKFSYVKYVIICATRVVVNLDDLAFKLNSLHQKFIIFAIHPEPNFRALTLKIYILWQKVVIFCATCAAANLVSIVFKISVLRQKLIFLGLHK